MIEVLGPDQLHELYLVLGIPSKDSEKAEQKAGKSPNLKAMAVLEWWRDTSPSEATRATLLKALEECRFIYQKQTLENKWSR